jgi:hypothetical protein
MATPYTSTSKQLAPSTFFVTKNPVLDKGEIGMEIDTGKFKIGDGTTKWVSLVYGNGNAPAVTGSKGANAALTSLLTQLAAAGIITDLTT